MKMEQFNEVVNSTINDVDFVFFEEVKKVFKLVLTENEVVKFEIEF